MDNITKIYSDVLECRQCTEFSEYHKFPSGCHGKGTLGIMIVGESSHKPSIDAGMYYAQGSVRSLLKDIIDLDKDCYLSDAIKCDKQFCSIEGKKLKGKQLDKIAKCCSSRFLLNEISILQPKAIIAVGRIAFEFLTGIKGDFRSRQNDGKQYHTKSSHISVYPVIHPSNANRNYSFVPWQEEPYDENFAQIVRNVTRNCRKN